MPITRRQRQPGDIVGAVRPGTTATRDGQLTYSGDPRISATIGQGLDIYESDPNLARAEGGQAAALATASPLGDEFRAFGESFANDPRLAALFGEYETRLSPDYSIVSDPQRAAMENELAGGVNRARQSRAAALRSRGLFGSGMDIENDPLFGAIGSVGLGQISAGIAEADAAARERALSGVTALTTDVERFQGDILSRAGAADQFTALLEKDVPLSDVDPLLRGILAEAFRQGEIDLDFLEEQLRLLEEESQFGGEDLLSGLLSFGTGFPGAAGDVIGSIGNIFGGG